MSSAHVSDLTAGYALGALTPEERTAVESHIGSCTHCRSDLAAMISIASTLPLACDSMTPPESLKDRVLAAADADARASAAIASKPPPSAQAAIAQLRPPQNAWVWMAGMAASVAVLLGITAAGLMHDRDALKDEYASQSAQLSQARLTNESLHRDVDQGHAVMTALASGTYWSAGPHRDVNGRTWRCSLVQPPVRGHNAMLLAMIPAPPRGMAYQVWVKHKGGMHKAGMVMHGGMTMLEMSMPVQQGDIVAFSIERPSGSVKPTLPYSMQISLE